jgi:hypothetical protein
MPHRSQPISVIFLKCTNVSSWCKRRLEKGKNGLSKSLANLTLEVGSAACAMPLFDACQSLLQLAKLIFGTLRCGAAGDHAPPQSSLRGDPLFDLLDLAVEWRWQRHGLDALRFEPHPDLWPGAAHCVRVSS